MGNFFFSIFPIMFIFVFFGVIVVFAIVIATLIKAAKQERSNRKAPILTVDATVVAKRILVQGDHSFTNYYATFQVPHGDRMELRVPHDQFGYLVEGDNGALTFQGTKCLGFTRN